MAFGLGDMESDLATGASYASGGIGAAQGGIAAAQRGLAQAQGVGNEISGMLGNASNLAGQAARIVNGADADIDALRGVSGNISGHIGSLGGSADALKGIAGGLNAASVNVGSYSPYLVQTGDALNNLAQLLQSAAGGVGGYAPTVAGLGDQLVAASNNVRQYAPAVAGLGDQLVGRIGLTDILGRQVQGVAAGLAPYSDALSALADHIFAHGHDMVGRANTVLDQGQGFMNMDPASSALAAEWLRQYAAVSPDAYAARAAADVQNAFDIARAQSQRELSRRGVSLSSGMSASLQKQLATALAAARAGNMMRGRETGRKEQVGILGSMSSLANQLLQTGTTMQKTGVDEELGSANARKAAADVTEAMGRLFANAGQIFGIGNDALQGAGTLYRGAADIEGAAASALNAAGAQYRNAASIEKDAADVLDRSGGRLVDAGTQYRGAASIEKDAADVLSDSARAEKDAADVTSAAIAAEGKRADIYSDAARLGLAQAGALNDTAKIHQGNAQVKNSYLSNLNDANRTIVGSYNALSDAMNRAANYYLGGAGIAQREYGGGGGGGVNVVSTPAPADDWFNWRGTGHSETWNANHNPNYEAMIG